MNFSPVFHFILTSVVSAGSGHPFGFFIMQRDFLHQLRRTGLQFVIAAAPDQADAFFTVVHIKRYFFPGTRQNNLGAVIDLFSLDVS